MTVVDLRLGGVRGEERESDTYVQTHTVHTGFRLRKKKKKKAKSEKEEAKASQPASQPATWPNMVTFFFLSFHRNVWPVASRKGKNVGKKCPPFSNCLMG